MKLKRNATLGAAFCVLIGLIAIGCNQTETTDNSVVDATTPVAAKTTSECCGGCCSEASQETVICQKCGQEKPAGGKAEGCADCPGGQCADGQCADAIAKTAPAKPAGCCGKCAEELVALTKPSEGSKTCQECAEGDSANCKCESEKTAAEGTEAKPAVETSAEGKAAGSAASTTADPASRFVNDRDVFHFLLSNKDKITRNVTNLKDGVETLTESSDPAIVSKIQEHVAAMYDRVENNQPIRMRDPLFREVFKHTDKIKMELANTENGIRVKETSEDEYVVKVIQEHAKVVSGFVEYGFEERAKITNRPSNSQSR